MELEQTQVEGAQLKRNSRILEYQLQKMSKMEERTVLSKPKSLRFRSFLIPAFLIMAVGAFQIGTIRSGQGWGDDFAAYILQTKHMATGHSFVPYEFIPNPVTMIGGQAYPPLL